MCMPIMQSIWSLEDGRPLPAVALSDEQELETALNRNISILSEDWLLIGRQVRTVAGGFIDLLCMDRNGDPIVVELKRNLTPREVTAQVIDYASCIANCSASDLANIYLTYRNENTSLGEAFQQKFGFPLEEENMNQHVRMVIVASQMDASTERIIQYLSQFGVDINILFFSVFVHAGHRFLSRAWLRDEVQVSAESTRPNREWNYEYYASFGAEPDGRQW